ncbi:MAG: HU family DNA-binding protein [Ignavibacteria bacterium]
MMIKPELVRNIVNKFEVGEAEVASFVDNIFVSMSDALRKGKNINIPEFGKFKVISKTKEGIKQRYISFSPVRQFAESVNDNFNNLQPQITKARNLKSNEILTIRECMSDEDDEDYLRFIFDEELDTQVTEETPPDIISVSDSNVNEDNSVAKTFNGSTEIISEDATIFADSIDEEKADTESAFELPHKQRRFLHDLKDDFSTEDIDNEITDLIFKRDELLKELELSETSSDVKEEETSPESELSDDDIIIPSSEESEPKVTEDDIIIPLETAEDKETGKDDDKTPESLDKPEESSEDINKHLIPETSNVELRIFQKLLSDQPSEQKDDVLLKKSEQQQDVISSNEPATLTDALDNLQNENIIQPLDTSDNKEPKSFNEVFVSKEPQYGVKSVTPKEKKKPLSVFMKVLIYTFFIACAAGISFFLYKTLFENLASTGIIENLKLHNSDSLKNHFADDEHVKGESVLIENANGNIFRKIDPFVYIENNVCDNIGEASDKEAKLKSNLVSCRIEAFMTLDNVIQYRVLVGPFESLEIANQYNLENKSVLNSVK